MSIIAIIPARAGSKGIPDKNLVLLGGRPLIEWTIRAALESGVFDHIVVSTDSERIAEAAKGMGAEAPFLRPVELSDDASPTMPVVLHALSHFNADTVVLLQPTSPLRNAEDIRLALDLFQTTGRPVVSVVPAKPWLFTQAADGGIVPFTNTLEQRQSAPVVAPNGAIYVASAHKLRAGETWWSNPVAYEMAAERSVDIDTATDLLIAEALTPYQRCR